MNRVWIRAFFEKHEAHVFMFNCGLARGHQSRNRAVECVVRIRTKSERDVEAEPVPLGG